jgi:hypothetical protein
MSLRIPFVDSSKSLDAIYFDLLTAHREMQKKLSSGDAECVHCHSKKRHHVQGDRCSSSACSNVFVAKFQKQYEDVEQGLSLVEQLRLI